jgi:hypothetical protein
MSRTSDMLGETINAHKIFIQIPVGTRPPNDQGVHWRTIQQTGWGGAHWIHLGDTGGSHGDYHEYIAGRN